MSARRDRTAPPRGASKARQPNRRLNVCRRDGVRAGYGPRRDAHDDGWRTLPSRPVWRQQVMAAPAERREAVVAQEVTLLELVQAVADVTQDEREIVATVMYMLQSGHARLIGNFRDEPIDSF